MPACRVDHLYLDPPSRDEGRLARRLMSSLNCFLITDGLNLAPSGIAARLHDGVREFVMRAWHTTRDPHLKVPGYSLLNAKLVVLLSIKTFLPYMSAACEAQATSLMLSLWFQVADDVQ